MVELADETIRPFQAEFTLLNAGNPVARWLSAGFQPIPAGKFSMGSPVTEAERRMRTAARGADHAGLPVAPLPGNERRV